MSMKSVCGGRAGPGEDSVTYLGYPYLESLQLTPLSLKALYPYREGSEDMQTSRLGCLTAPYSTTRVGWGLSPYSSVP